MKRLTTAISAAPIRYNVCTRCIIIIIRYREKDHANTLYPQQTPELPTRLVLAIFHNIVIFLFAHDSQKPPLMCRYKKQILLIFYSSLP